MESDKNELKTRLMKEPDNPDLLFKLGKLYQDEEKHKKALSLYKRVTNIAPQHDTALNNYAFSLFALDNTEEAIQWYNKAISLDPYSSVYWSNLALAHFRLGDYKNGKLCFEISQSLERSEMNASENGSQDPFSDAFLTNKTFQELN